ncbi:MAG: Zn-dependent hydrolase, partial [Bacteroidetes bacterium]|nr:Zn-dependent hydrolase [Bacteroidota bacterium]
YRIDFEKMKQSVTDLGKLILTIQGDGDFAAAKKLVEEKGSIREVLQNDLNRINAAGIPKDIVFEQGKEVLGL